MLLLHLLFYPLVALSVMYFCEIKKNDLTTKGEMNKVCRIGGIWRFPESEVKRLIKSFEV